ncbi:phage tail protein [Escherichia coli]|nr:phage tail protein [Escherichia coli]
MKTFRWKVKPDMEVNSQPSVREVRFGDGYSQRMAAGLNADLKTYRVTLSVTREEAPASGSVPAEHGGWKAFFRKPPYAYRQIKVTCAGWSARVGMLRVEFSAEFKQVVN